MGIKNIVNNYGDWEDFREFVTENFLDPAIKQLKQETDYHRIAQIQGKIKAYEQIIDLRDTVNGRE